jgi:hypothetical protein
MSNPLDKLKKLKGRSWSEIRTRGEQVISGYSEKIGFGSKIPSDESFLQLLDKQFFSSSKITSEVLRYEILDSFEFTFFASFREKDAVLERLSNNVDNKKIFLEKAKKIVNGRFDLLGFQNLDFGENVNWHYEPLSGKQSPLKHWKQFDELSTHESGDKKIIWELNRHQYFFTLGIAYWLTDDEKYAETFARHLDSWMEQNPPGIGVNWMSSLEVAFRVISWVWAFQFFKNSEHLTAELFVKALKFLHIHGKHLEKYLSTYYSPNTHLTGEALGLYYLGTQFPMFQRANYWKKIGQEILLAELDRQVLNDGVYFEQSTWYQKYTVDFYTQFLILKTLNGNGIDLKLQEKLVTKLQSMLDFMMYVTRPDGTTPLIGDDDGGKCLPDSTSGPTDFRSVLSTGSVLFGRGDYKHVAGDFADESLWLLGTEGLNRFNTLSAHLPKDNSKAFADGGYFVMRDGWTKTDNYLLIDCGVHGSLSCGHSHADALAIDVAIGGKTLLIDPGTYTYHESEEWRNFFRSTMAHNTLTVDGKSSSEPGGKFNWETQAQAKPKRWLSQDRFDYFEGLHKGYERLDNLPVTHHRSVLFLKNEYWIIRDYAETFGTHKYDLNFHFNANTNPEVTSAKNGIWCVDEENGSGLRLFTFGDNGQWKKKESWVSPIFGQKVNAPFLSFVSEGSGSQEFFTFLLPNYKGIEKPEVFETEVSGGRAFVIKYRGYNDLFVFGDGDGQIIRTELFDTDFRFLWARVSDDNLPEEFVMVDGANFHLNGREIVNYPQKLQFAIARRLGNRLNVRTNESIFSVSLTQSNSGVRILKGQD